MSIERPRPYIGFSGVISPNQQYYLMDHFVHEGLDEPPMDRQILLGVKGTDKTQNQDIENTYGDLWYPVGGAFYGALDDGGIAALRTAQLFLDPERVHNEEYRDNFIEIIQRRGKAWMNAIQFDMLPFHENDSILPWLEKVKEDSELTVILQAHGEAMSELGPEGIIRRLGRTAGYIDYLLFDASHGKGVRMDASALEPFLYAAYSAESLSASGVAIAGGLNADVVREEIPALIEKYCDLSWDAEGQLHPVQADGTRPIDMQRARAYMAASAEVLTFGRYN